LIVDAALIGDSIEVVVGIVEEDVLSEVVVKRGMFKFLNSSSSGVE
jgi:hypothetical protein